MTRYSTEGEFGRSRLDERLNKRVMGPRAHRAPRSSYPIPENTTDFLDFRGYEDEQYVLHVHQTGLTLKEAQKVVDEVRPGYQIRGLRSCDPTIDEEGNPGSFIILQSKGSDGLFDPAPPRVPEEAEPLTPKILGKRLFGVFEGYDYQFRLPSDQLSFLLRHHHVSPTEDGNPVYTLTTPEADEPVRPWKKSEPFFFSHGPATTEKYLPESPQIVPASLHYAREIITMTHAHHFFTHPQHEEHDVLFTKIGGGIIIPFTYIKGEEPIEPRPAYTLEGVASDPLWTLPETMIQLWKFLPEDDTYQLQATLKTHKISITDFFRVMGTQPSELQ
jgi:hypothetical protein